MTQGTLNAGTVIETKRRIYKASLYDNKCSHPRALGKD
jgi:hypothetical protein